MKKGFKLPFKFNLSRYREVVDSDCVERCVCGFFGVCSSCNTDAYGSEDYHKCEACDAQMCGGCQAPCHCCARWYCENCRFASPCGEFYCGQSPHGCLCDACRAANPSLPRTSNPAQRIAATAAG